VNVSEWKRWFRETGRHYTPFRHVIGKGEIMLDEVTLYFIAFLLNVVIRARMRHTYSTLLERAQGTGRRFQKKDTVCITESIRREEEANRLDAAATALLERASCQVRRTKHKASAIIEGFSLLLTVDVRALASDYVVWCNNPNHR